MMSLIEVMVTLAMETTKEDKEEERKEDKREEEEEEEKFFLYEYRVDIPTHTTVPCR